MGLNFKGLFPPPDERDDPLSNRGVVDELTTAGLLKSVQYGTVTHNDTVNTATINAVVVANSVIQFLGTKQDAGGAGEADDYFAYVELTNSTTVTATKADADLDSNSVLSFCVIEFEEDVLTSNQRGKIVIGSGATTNTGNINAVTLGNTMLVYLGFTTTDTTADYDEIDEHVCMIQLTNTTTITATRDFAGTSATTVSFQIVEFA